MKFLDKTQYWHKITYPSNIILESKYIYIYIIKTKKEKEK